MQIDSFKSILLISTCVIGFFIGITKNKADIKKHMQQQTIGFTASRAKDGIIESSKMKYQIFKNIPIKEEIKKSTYLPKRGIMNCEKNTLCAKKFKEDHFNEIMIRIKDLQE
ncbi:hypothetical protein [Comamonas sp.]|uniref:hypothetical protein n=1 Tax=Comamonas sp. TaxID=34028 RepID=UPI00289C6E9E|nr:hypothetical protein [Comamonas sp.]